MEMLGRIRRMYYRDKLSRSEIARRTGLSRNTVKRWLRAEEGVVPRYRRGQQVGKLDAFKGWLEKALEVDAGRAKRDRRTALALFGEIKAQGYAGGYTMLTTFIRHWRARAQANVSTRAFVPLKFELGEAFQFDWSEEHLMIGGVWRTLQVAHLKLCASRAFVLVAYPSQGHEMLFDAHTRSFQALGGVPRRGIYDNMKTAVDRVKKGKGRIVNARFAALCSHYLFDAEFCNVAAGWEKGVVEKNVQDSRRRVWQGAAKERFSTLADLNQWLLGRCKALWQSLPHPQCGPLTIAEILEHEQPHLMPMVSPFNGYVEEPGRVSSTCLVNVARNHYSVPCELAGKMVSKRLYPERIDFVFEEQIRASHPRLFDRGQTCYDWQHYLGLLERKPGALRNGAPFADMPAPLVRLQRLLLRRDGGDRLMSQMLACVPRASLETVLVAVELVLESGQISVEHLQNVIARLNQAPPAPSVETRLTLDQPPVADTARYDSLRAAEVNHA
jgi:transposase